MATLINGYPLDVAISEDHDFESEVTEHPVEIGADITDHVRARPIRVSLEGVVSDTPIGDVVAQRSQFTLVNGEAFTKPSEEAFAFLLAIRDAREPVTIETSLRVFENMILQSLAVPRSSSNGDALRFRATFVQVQLVTNERVTVRVKLPNAAKKVDRGNRASADAAVPPPEYLTRAGNPDLFPAAANSRGRSLAGVE